uniref:ATP synthase F1 subunit epsilon n=1 Tax=Strongyloides stercoralis TaxID=6248 RepID=A0A0K0E9E3_STRER
MTRNSEQSVIYPLSTFTTLTTLVIVTNKDWKVILNQQHQLFSLISLFVFLTIYGIIITLEQIRFMKGINYIAAFLLAISLGFLIAVESSWYTLATNLNSIFISCIVAITISSMAFSVKRDLTIHMDKLIISTFIFMIAACLIFILSKIIDTSTIRHFYCLGGFLLSCAYIAVDTQSISTKDRYNQLATNEYVLGGVQIFVDFSYLFYYCMGVIGTVLYLMTLSQEFFSPDRNEKSIVYSFQNRTQFFKKTIYHTLLFLTLTIITTLLIIANNKWKIILNQQHQFFSLISLFIFLTIYGVIITLEQIRFMKGINYVAAFLLAISLGFLIAVETSWYSFETNVNSIFIACIVAVTISGIALNVKYDVTTYKSKLILLTFTFMIMSCLLFLLSHFFDTFVLRKLYSIGGFFLSCGYIAIDTQSISIISRYDQLTTNEHVLGGVQIFVDYSYLFYYCMGSIGTGSFISTK